MPLPGNKDFRKDVREGADATIASLADEAHKGKTEVVAQVIHTGSPHEIRAWVPSANLTLAVDDPKQSVVPDTEADPGLGPAIVDGDPFGKEVEPHGGLG